MWAMEVQQQALYDSHCRILRKTMCLVQQFNFRSKVNKARLEFKMAKNVMNEIETWTSIYLEMLYIYY